MTQHEIKSQANVHPITISAGDAKPQSEQHMSRRGFGGLALAGVMSAALAACGGGSSDPTGVTSTSSQSDELLKAYKRITGPFTSDELIAAVGRVPNDVNADNEKDWSNSSETLWVSLALDNSYVWRVDGVSYRANDGTYFSKSIR